MQNNDKQYNTEYKTQYDLKQSDIDFHGAAIVDQDGHEIPITEDMIQSACSDLEDASASLPKIS